MLHNVFVKYKMSIP